MSKGPREGPSAFQEIAMSKPKPKSDVRQKPSTKPQVASKTVILFGADEYGKPRAARFTGVDEALLTKAAETMRLRQVPVAGAELESVASRLPAGRVQASGEGLVPFVRGDLYAELVGLTVGEQKPCADLKSTKGLPSSADQIGEGHLVLAHETLECGWWEAVVIERKGDLVMLRYRDYPAYPPLVRHLSAVALIYPEAK
jgi:hypothetical protein